MRQCRIFRAFRHSLSVTDLTAHLRSGTAKRKDSAMAFAYHRRARERDRFERNNDAPAITADNPARDACCLTHHGMLRRVRRRLHAATPIRAMTAAASPAGDAAGASSGRCTPITSLEVLFDGLESSSVDTVAVFLIVLGPPNMTLTRRVMIRAGSPGASGPGFVQLTRSGVVAEQSHPVPDADTTRRPGGIGSVTVIGPVVASVPTFTIERVKVPP